MTSRVRVVWIKEQSRQWLTIYLSLWLAFAYLWLALYYPLMCAPYRSTAYKPLSQVETFAHTITPFSLVMNNAISWPLYVTSDNAPDAAWLLHSHNDAMGLALSFINAISAPDTSWLKPIQLRYTDALLDPEQGTQFHDSPPTRPPRLSSL
jgi:hypothetical protein